MLENFDFSKPKDALDESNEDIGSGAQDEQDELERIRSKFANQGLVEIQPGEEDEEVVIVKKKKKSSKKKNKKTSKTSSKTQEEKEDARQLA